MRADRTKDLPDSDAVLDGATKGSMGDATQAQVRRGYSPVKTEEDRMTEMFNDKGGFLGRPGGYER